MAEIKPIVLTVKWSCLSHHEHNTLEEAQACIDANFPLPTLDVINFHVCQLPKEHQKIYEIARVFDLSSSDFQSPEWQLNSRILECFTEYARRQDVLSPMRPFRDAGT